uniref:Uncharacterized protein n=1 Tax=Arundo donax TaxID=35708 RepID=A0A0A9BSG3_ARUDO
MLILLVLKGACRQSESQHDSFRQPGGRQVPIFVILQVCYLFLQFFKILLFKKSSQTTPAPSRYLLLPCRR